MASLPVSARLPAYARKLARSGFLAFLLLAAGCSPEDAVDPGADGLDSSFKRGDSWYVLVISPDSATLAPYQTWKFTARSYRRSRPMGSIGVTWTATGGTIDSAGNFTAGETPGKYRVVARGQWGGPADSSTVTITASSPTDPTVSGIVVTPASASVASGASETFTAVAQLSDGSTKPALVTWTATGGTIDSTGKYTAGSNAGAYRVIARQLSGELADTSAVTVTATAPPPSPTVSQIVVAPGNAALAPGASQKFTATAKLSDGTTQPASVTWTATGGTIDTQGNYLAGLSGGAFRVIGRQVSGTLADTSAITINTTPTPSDTNHAGFYVSPTGSSGNPGTKAGPWSLSYALGGAGGQIQPGDTVWLRGGTYSGYFSTSLNGTSSAPIIFRGYPGEQPKIDGGLSAGGSYVWIWGWEVIDSRSSSYDRACIDFKTRSGRLINNIVHDCSGNGIGAWWDGPNQELTGNISYNNGRNTPHVGHGIYTNNETGSKLYRDNAVFLNAGYGFHGYETVMSCLCNMTFRGNASFQNGMRASGYGGYDFFVGGSTPTRGLVLDDNYNYRNLGNGNRGLLAGDEAVGGTQNQDVHAHRGIYVGDPSVKIHQFGTVDTAQLTRITVGSFPTSGTTVVVRPNPYERGRGHVIAYNWGQAGSVSADLSSVLSAGQTYSIYSVQRLFGAPVATGTYGGGSVSIPMAPIPAPPMLVAGKTNLTPPPTGPRFDVFLVVSQ
jgi:hypothetical protein